MATYGEIITRVMTRLSAMGGLDVQTYMQPKIAEMIRYRYDQIFLMRFWRQSRVTTTFTTDPLTGLPTVPLSPVLKRFIDIQYIIPTTYSRPIPEKRVNVPSTVQQELCYEPYNATGQVFRILPLLSSTHKDFGISYRSQQTTWVESDEVNIDDQLIILGVCADYSVGEGANMEMAQTFGTMYADRLRQLVNAELQHEKSQYRSGYPGIYEWH